MFQLRFQLTPLEELSEDWRHRWFYLTDGFYWIEADGKELFRYSETQLAIWKEQGDTDSLPYAHYPIERFWQDFLDLTRSALCPVPEDIFAWVKDAAHWAELEAQIDNLQETISYPSPEWDSLFSIRHWWAERRLDSYHFTVSPSIWLYRVDDTMFLRWETGAEFAGPATGEVAIPLEDFLQELRRFDAQLMEQMQQRILELPNREDLQRAQDFNQTMLQNTLDFPLCADWDAVRAACSWLREELA